jgi:hypothetical protein
MSHSSSCNYVYHVCDNSNLEYLEKMYTESYAASYDDEVVPHLIIDWIGYDHDTTSFEMSGTKTINITYADQFDENSFVVPIISTKLNCTICLKPSHKFYSQYMASQWHNQIKTNIVNVNEQLFGIRLCDLVKHFVMTNKNNPFTMASDDYNTKKFNKKVIDITNKIVRTDFSQFNANNILGTYHHNDHLIRIWSALMEQHHINPNTNTFVDYFQKIIYFSEDTLNKFLRSRHVNDAVQCFVIHSQLINFMKSLSDEQIITKIMRHYLFNEDPSINDVCNMYYFDIPKKIPDILSMIYEISQETRYLDIRNQITKKLNANQKQLLKEKYIDITFDNVCQVPQSRPFYALRNVSLFQWSLDYDIVELIAHLRSYMLFVRTSRAKHKHEIAGKTYFNNPDNCNLFSHFPDNNSHRAVKKFIANEIYDYEHSSCDYDYDYEYDDIDT